MGTYTHGTSKGIQVYDVDVEKGTLTERKAKWKLAMLLIWQYQNGKYLYSIEDEGVEQTERDKNSDLTRLNSVDINGNARSLILQQMWTEDIFMWQGTKDSKVTVVHTLIKVSRPGKCYGRRFTRDLKRGRA